MVDFGAPLPNKKRLLKRFVRHREGRGEQTTRQGRRAGREACRRSASFAERRTSAQSVFAGCHSEIGVNDGNPEGMETTQEVLLFAAARMSSRFGSDWKCSGGARQRHSRSVQLTTAVHHATVSLTATCRRWPTAAPADREGRELLLELFRVTPGTLRRLRPEKDGFEPVSTTFATVFEYWHQWLQG